MLHDDPRERDSVLRDLASDDDEVRRLAVERSAALAPREVVPQLVDCLGDVSWRVRKAAVERLSAWPDGDAVARALIAALGDGDNPGRRNAAVDALIHCGASVVRELEAAIVMDDVDVRKFAVDVLAGIGDPSAVPALIDRLEDDDTNVRAATADALGAIGGDGAIAALVAAATSDAQDSLVRFSALHGLASLGEGVPASELSGALEDPVLRPAALGVLGRLEGDAAGLEVLVKALESRARAPREAAMRSLLRGLSHLDGPAADALVRSVRDAGLESPELLVSAIERLSEADLPTRLVLLQFLGLLRPPEAAVPLLLAAGDEALQQVAIGALASMGEVAEQAIDDVWCDLGSDARRDACLFFGHAEGPRSADRLVSALDDPDPVVRSAAARSLGSRGVPDALAPLVGRLRLASPDELEGGEERSAVTHALIQLAGGETHPAGSDLAERAIGLLVQALEGAAEPVRVAVAQVIGCIGRSEDSEVVSLLLKDASEKVRRAAVSALVRIEPNASGEPLHLAIADESVDVRIAVAAALGESDGSEAFPDLCRLAEDADPRVRATAVRAVGLSLSSEATEDHRTQARRVLETACADEVPVALAAVEAMLATGDCPERMLALLRRTEPEVVREAVHCLGVHGDEDQLEAVIPLCAHPDWPVRAEAIQVLADRGATRALPAILRRLDLERDPFVRSVTLQALEKLEG